MEEEEGRTHPTILPTLQNVKSWVKHWPHVHLPCLEVVCRVSIRCRVLRLLASDLGCGFEDEADTVYNHSHGN